MLLGQLHKQTTILAYNDGSISPEYRNRNKWDATLDLLQANQKVIRLDMIKNTPYSCISFYATGCYLKMSIR